MSEKVLGFKEKVARKWIFDKDRDSWAVAYHYKDATAFEIETNKLVPVRLKSESVSLQTLKEELKRFEIDGLYIIGASFRKRKFDELKNNLLSWAEKQAGEKKE